MEKITKFQRAVKKNRKKLREAGYPGSTIHAWEHGVIRNGRNCPVFPRLETAIELSVLLDLKTYEIPYYRVERF